MKNELVITNTLFQHKMPHRTTWECPERKNEHKDKDGGVRRNPYRNQIDYILVRIKHRALITNSRSYNGLETFTDHRLVKANLNINWQLVKYNTKKRQSASSINIQLGLRDPSCRKLYSEAVKKAMENKSSTNYCL